MLTQWANRRKFYFLVIILLAIMSDRVFAASKINITVKNTSIYNVTLDSYEPGLAYYQPQPSTTIQNTVGVDNFTYYASPPTGGTTAQAGTDPYSPFVKYRLSSTQSGSGTACNFFYSTYVSNNSCFESFSNTSNFAVNCWVCSNTYDASSDSCNITFAITNSGEGCPLPD